MVAINPLGWGEINEEDVYVINPFKLTTSSVDKRPALRKRLGCFLRAESVSPEEGKFPFFRYFSCSLNPQSLRTPEACFSHTSLRLRRGLFPPYALSNSRGSLLVRIHHGRCHKCGWRSLGWVLWNKHFICRFCIDAGRSRGPFPFGKGLPACCENNGCGQSEEFLQEKLFQQAVDIYQRYNG